jgi:hypothetical protein
MPAPRFQNNDIFGAPGVYIRELAPTAPVRGQLRNTVAFVGQCVRGPVGRTVEITSYQRFIDVFGGRDRGAGGVIVGHIWRALQAKQFGKLVISRAAAAAATTASFNAETAAGGAGTEVLKVAASSPGVWGQDVRFKVSAATNAVTTSFNLTVRYLGKDTTYQNLSINGTDDNLSLVIKNDDATTVLVTKLAAGRPVNNAISTDGADIDGFVGCGQTVAGYTSVAGTDGTIADTDYTGTGKAMDLVNSVAGVGVCLVAGRSNTAIKTKLFALAAVANERIWLACPNDETVGDAAAITEAGTLREDRLAYVFNHEYIMDPQTGEEIVDEPHAMIASILSQTEPDVHPGVTTNSDYTKGITRMFAQLSNGQRDALDAAGITFMTADLDQNGNSIFIPGNGVTTDLSNNNRQIDGRRSKDFLVGGLVFRARGDQNQPNTPKRRAARKASYEGWLTGLAADERFVATDDDGVPQFSVVNDASVNSQTDIDAGIQKDFVRIKLISKNLILQLRVETGTDVTITEL